MRASGRDGDISAWEVFQYFYCPRKLYFIRKLSVYPPERKKMAASSEEHLREHLRVGRRKTVYGFPEGEVDCILKDVVMERGDIGLYGRLDTALRMKSGEIIPVETKHSNMRAISLPWHKQLVAYALLLEDKFKTQIRRGLIYLLPSRLTLTAHITDEDKSALIKDLDRMREMIESDSLPRRVSKEKCGYCEIKKFCGPA